MMKFQANDNPDTRSERRDKKISDRSKPSDNRKSVKLIADLGKRPANHSRNLPKRNAK